MKVLRAVMGFLVGASLAATAVAQSTSLTINGATASDNSATVSAVAGATITFQVQNAATPNRPYGIIGAVANNGAASGWYLIAGGPKNPFPLVTGVATSIIEADYGINIVPDRGSNPNVKLNASGSATLTLQIPASFSGTTFYFQAVTLASGASSTDFSNAVEVDFVASTKAARMIVSQGVTVDSVTFGVLEFANGDPTTATFTPDGTLTNIRPETITMGDINEWTVHTAIAADKAREVDYRTPTFGPAYNCENTEYHRIGLPPLPGADGIPGNSDDIPPRDLMRCFDATNNQGFFLVVNKGANPNTPGVDVFAIPGTRKTDSLLPTAISWKAGVALSPDGSRAASIFDDTGAGIDPKMFLFATDGSLPYLDSGLTPVAIVDVTPAGTKNFNSTNNLRTTIFTNNRLWFTRDTAVDADGDARNDMTLFGADIRAAQPAPQQVVVAANANYATPVTTDVILERSMIVPRGGGTTMCFVAGNDFQAGNNNGAPPESVKKGDWYAVSESAPATAVNVTGFDEYGTPPPGTAPRILIAGDVYNGFFGGAALSPDGTRLAFISLNGAENPQQEDDEVYIARTTDADGNGLGDDAGVTLMTSPISNNSRINSVASQSLDGAKDVCFIDNDNLLFFYGQDDSNATQIQNRVMDVMHFNISTSTFSVLTRTVTLPITTAGLIVPEGYFLSPNGRYFYFARGTITSDARTNLVGIDTQTKKVFNITGTEFPGPTTGATKPFNTGATAQFGENFFWHLSYAGGQYPSLCYFAAPLETFASSTAQVWVFDANFPTTAIQLTNNNTGATIESIESLTGSPVSLGCAWAATRGTTTGTTAASDYNYQDLLYFFRDLLSETAVPFTSSTTLGAIDWVRAGTANDPTGAAPPALICAIGDTSSVDQASDAEFYYFSLDGTMNYDFDNAAQDHQMGTLTGFLMVYHCSVQ